MTVLVAGGAGFIGSHLCARLLEAGDEVVCLDNLLTGREQNLAPIREHPRFSFARADLMNASSPTVNWANLTAKLSDAPATDVRLDAAG